MNFLLEKKKKEQSYFQICPFTSQAIVIFLFVCFVLGKNAVDDLGSFSGSCRSLCSPVVLEPASGAGITVLCACSSEEMASEKVRPWLLWRFCSIPRQLTSGEEGRGDPGTLRIPADVRSWPGYFLVLICSKKYKCHHMSCSTEVFTHVLP